MRLAALLLLVPAALAPQSSTTPQLAPCSGPQYRQFDFWVGRWDVTGANGRHAGTNQISRIDGGCALREEWKGAGGSTGTSLNSFDATTGRWHQTWVGSDGLLLLLDGGMKDGSMGLTGTTVGRDGVRALHRIRWTPLDGQPPRVRQLW